MIRVGSTAFRLSVLLALLLVIGTTVFNGSALAGPAPDREINLGNPQTDQVIVKYRESADLTGSSAPADTARMQALSVAAGESLSYVRAMSGDAHVLRLSAAMPLASVEAIAARLAALPDVEYAEPDYIMTPTLVPNDPSYGAQWHYYEAFGVNAPGAWDITTGSASIRIAVIDTGITDHPDLAGRWVGGYDFITNVPTANDGDGRDSDPHDPGDWVVANECGIGTPARNSSWHGTHVAGTIGAASNNALGVAGLNWVSQVLPVRVLGKCGGFTSDIADGMRWAAGLAVVGVPANANPAKVLNLSLGGSGSCSATYQSAINAINAVGAIVSVSAGNSNANASGFQPASCNGVFTVTATDRDGNRAFYSNFGAVVEISAPGGETNTSPVPQNGVLSTLNAGLTTPGAPSYAYYQGTSMASPHIAGVLSLMVSISPTLNYTQSVQILQDTAQAFPAGSNCSTSTCGAGIADAAAALFALANPGEPTATATATQTGQPGPTATPTNAGRATRTPTVVQPTATFTPTGQPGPTATPTRTARASRTPTSQP